MRQLLIGTVVIALAAFPLRAAAQVPSTRGEVKVGEIKLAYQTFGPEAGETVLFISGIGGGGPTPELDPLSSHLVGEGYRVVHFDNRDSGASTRLDEAGVPDFAAIQQATAQGENPELPYTLDDLAADAMAVLDTLDVHQAHVGGGSMGGMVAQLVAADHPHRTISLTLTSSSSGNPELSIGEPPAGGDQMEPAALRQAAATLAAGDLRARISRITAPTLVIQGKQDQLFPPAHGMDLAETIAGANLVVLAGMGHLPEATHYQQIWKAMQLILD